MDAQDNIGGTMTGTPGEGRGEGRRRGGAAAVAQFREPLMKMFDRPRPQALDAEMSLIGAMILDARVIPDVLPHIPGPEAFASEANGRIYRLVRTLADKHGSVDTVMLEQALRDEGSLDLIGGSAYLDKLVYDTTGPAFASHHAKIVADKFKLRNLIDAASEILYSAYHGGHAEGPEVKLLIDAAEQRIFEIAQEENVSEMKSLEDLLHEEFERLVAMDAGNAPPTGVMTGFAELDAALSGMQPSDLIIIAARPSVGKTAFAMNIAEQIALGTNVPGSSRAVRPGEPVGVFSLEMSKNQLAQRLLSAWTGFTTHQLRSGHLPKDGVDVCLDAVQRLSKAPIYVDDTPGLTLMSLRARARRMRDRYKIRALFIDYLQLLSAPGSARESRQVEVSAISRGLKALARELKVPVVALSQLNRGPEQREDGKPRLGDLRESGSLEQDADVVLLLHREAAHHKNDPDWEANNPDKIHAAECHIAKQRNGPLGVVPLVFDGPTTRFKTADRHHGGGGGGHHTGIHYAPPQPFTPPRAPDPPPPIVTRPQFSGGFVSAPKTGPVANFRDGGGPDADPESDTYDDRPLSGDEGGGETGEGDGTAPF
jgi:replicative DNA helicase